MDAFDADALIYAASPTHELGRAVTALLEGNVPRIGSVLLLPELLSKPVRDHQNDELERLLAILGRVDLLDLDDATARLAVVLGAKYRLRAADAVHLATAVNAGADRFITNNRDDFPDSIDEIDVVYPSDL